MRLAVAVAAVGMLSLPPVAGALRPAVPATPVAGVSSLNGIACPTSKACVAVGLGGSEDNDGKSVAITAATGAVKAWSGAVTDDAMNAVACPRKISCLAVADDAIASVEVSSAAMKVTATPKRPRGGIVALGAIACASSERCYAVGFEGTNEAHTNAVVISLSSAGKLLADKKDTGTGIGAIACPSSKLCLMSDASHSGTSIQWLKSGHAGTSQPLPTNTYVEAISCYKARLCYALGGNRTSSPAQTNELFPLNPKRGKVGSKTTIKGFSGTDISCVSASMCLVSGFTGSGSTAKPAIVAVVDGKPGAPVNYGGNSDSFHSVGCASTSECYAVGSSSSGAIVDKVKS